MNLQCLFGHKWKEIGRRIVDFLEDINDRSTFTRSETRFLLQCQKCGDMTLRTFKGSFLSDNDSDDGPREDPTPISPDDFYDSLEIKND